MLPWKYIDQGTAQRLGPLAEAVANAFMVVYYQAETGMSDKPVKLTPAPEGYVDWLAELKTRIERLSQDLRSAFPEMKGSSRANLTYMRAFAAAWPDEQIVQQAVGQLPWGHNLVLLSLA